MAFTIPNEADAFHRNQAEPDTGDIRLLVDALAGKGVVSGLGVSASGTDLVLTIASGTVRIGGAIVEVGSGTVTPGAAHSTNPRIDLVTIAVDGSRSILAGTPAPVDPGPVFPTWSATQEPIYAVYVASAVTALTASHLVDKRVTVTDTGVLASHTQTGDYTFALVDIARSTRMDSTTAQALTVPPSNTVPFPVGTILPFAQLGTGQVTLTAGAGVALHARGVASSVSIPLAGRWAGGSLEKLAPDDWLVLADVA